MRFVLAALFALVLSFHSLYAQTDEWTNEKFWAAARSENIESVKAALAAGIDVDAKTDYGATALFFACDRGNAELVKVLLDAGANPNFKDTFYNSTPMTWARQKNHMDVVKLLLAGGADGADAMLMSAVSTKNISIVSMVLETQSASDDALAKAKAMVDKGTNEKLKELFAEVEIGKSKPAWTPTAAELARYAGNYKSDRMTVTVEASEDTLSVNFGQGDTLISPVAKNEFMFGQSTVQFVMDGEQVESLEITSFGRKMKLVPVSDSEPPARDPEPPGEPQTENPEFQASRAESLAADRKIASANWPGFRGNGSRGVAEGQNPPARWDVTAEENVAWKTPVPGLGLSCPTIWGDLLFVTSAINKDNPDQQLRTGLYGDVASVQDESVYQFNVYCLDKNTGEIQWTRTANEAKPKVKRHAKSSHANCTVATDGTHVVAFFGSEGLYCYDTRGNLLWKKDLGTLDSGWFYDASYQWGFGASPTIFEDTVIVQCDIQEGSFVAALNVNNGEELWRTDREEIPSWSSPTVHEFDDVAMLLTHGTRAARGYDARTGQLLWSLPKHSEIVVPTPFVAQNKIFVASGYSPIQPIYAIRPTARGNIALEGDASTNEHIAWSYQRGGPYMPSPVAYGDYLYCCSNAGILTCYEMESGLEVYKRRLRTKVGSGRLAFTASPLAADGKLYLTAEDGRVLVIKAGPQYELLETNIGGEQVLATPAISNGRFYLRGKSHVIALGK